MLYLPALYNGSAQSSPDPPLIRSPAGAPVPFLLFWGLALGLGQLHSCEWTLSIYTQSAERSCPHALCQWKRDPGKLLLTYTPLDWDGAQVAGGGGCNQEFSYLNVYNALRYKNLLPFIITLNHVFMELATQERSLAGTKKDLHPKLLPQNWKRTVV